MKSLLYYVSGHGFGHAVRSAMVIRELYRLGIRAEIITSAPRHIFDCNLKGVDFGYHQRLCDVGVVQSDSLSNNLPQTCREWSSLLDGEKEWIDEHLELCRRLKPSAVVGDIVPFAFRLARRAGLPSILVTSFTWDWILQYYKDDDPLFGELSRRMEIYYLEAGLMIYTPLSFGLPKVARSRLIPLIGKKSIRSEEEIRRALGLDARPAVMVSFGGLGLKDINKLGLESIDNFQFLFLSTRPARNGNLITFSCEEADHAELVKVSRVVLTKPGYGIATEAILNRIPIIYTSRGKFAEYEPLVKELKNYIPIKFITQEELFGGRLRPYLEDEMRFLKNHKTDPGNGARMAAELISEEAL